MHYDSATNKEYTNIFNLKSKSNDSFNKFCKNANTT